MNYLLIAVMLVICMIMVIVEKSISVKARKIIFFVFALLFSVFFSMRDITTRDTGTYIHIFQSVDISDGLFAGFDRYEVGYLALNRIIKSLKLNYPCLFFLSSFLNYSLLYWVLKEMGRLAYREKNKVVASKETVFFFPVTFILLYTSYFGLLYNSIVMRACVAFSILYVAVVFVKSKKWLLGILIYIISIMFHGTMILAFPIVLIFGLNLKIKRNICILFVVGCLALYFLGIGEMTTALILPIISFLCETFPESEIFWWINNYLTNNAILEKSISLNRLLYYLIVCFILFQKGKKDKISDFELTSVLGIVIFTFFGNVSLAIRAAEVYLVSTCFSLLQISKENSLKYKVLCVQKNKVLVVPGCIVIIVLSICFYIVFLRNVAFKV